MKKILLVLLLLSAVAGYLIYNPFEVSHEEFIKNKGKKILPGPDMRPAEWAWLQRTYPFYNADPSVYRKAIEEHNALLRSRNALSKGASVQWEFAGPLNVGGRVVDIEFNPLNPNIVYAGAATGGVFKSTDMGETWFSIFDGLSTLSIGDIAVDPVNPDIIYVGTGEPNGGHNNFPGAGVFKSTNAGASWEYKGLDSTISIGRVIINPSNPSIVYLAAVGSYFAPTSERGVYKSTDAGETWNKSLFISDSTGAIDLVMDPSNPDIILAAMWERVRRPNGGTHLFGAESGIYKTTNGGGNWTKLANGLPNSSATNVGRIGLGMSKSSPNIVYAMYTDGNYYSGFYKTTNQGSNWINVDSDMEISNGTSSFSWYFGQVRVHPQNPNIVYAMDVAFMRSSDGGNNWPINYGYGGPDHLHVDHHALAFHPTNPNYIINGNDGGINISTDAGVNWSQPKQLPITQFYEIGVDKNNPSRLFGGTQDNGTVRTTTGAVDDWDRIFGGDGFYVIVDPVNPNIIYAESQFGNLGKSTNGGFSFFSALSGISSSEPTNWSTPVVMDANNSSVLYYGTNRLYKTTNGAQNWSAISGSLTSYTSGSRLGTITTIAVAPTDPNYIYVGADDGFIHVTTNGGTNWTKISNNLPVRWVTRIAVDPKDKETVYVTYSGLKWKDPQPHIFKSSNRGADWVNISGNLPDAPINALAVSPSNSNYIFIGSDIGAYYSSNRGDDWEVIGTGLPVVSVYDIKIHPTEGYLVAGTHGRSMYKLDLSTIVGVEDNMVVADYLLSQNYPNPFNPSTRIRFSIPSEEDVLIKVYNASGEEVSTLVNKSMSKGLHEVAFSGEGLASGVYFYSIKAGKFSEVRKMVLLK
jgi:photosystem II stability/assembly factor-like uncharacterized protein